MSEWALKRFWTEAKPLVVEGGYSITLDERAVKTPAKAALVVPTLGLAEAIAAEWRAVDTKIDPNVMPFTRSANAAIDKVSVQFDEVVELISAYADSDLLCYRADSPVELRSRQDSAWDVLLDWAKKEHGLKLTAHEGVMHKPQAAESLAVAQQLTQAMSAFELTAFHDLVGMSGSFVLGLATAAGVENPENMWKTSRIDELWQEELWGKDEEATQTAAIKEAAFAHAARFFELAT
ncbi:ATPase [Lentibacter algarum]|uniref:ATP12 family chaperone protein n=1 Tax=Lentibacter algarum TaxID=576131 RepID=UPI001C07CCA8|nr:ATP12 family protein [Lentibacter algarum]MBU2980265.1 ATPase [Lentibacter algarum]